MFDEVTISRDELLAFSVGTRDEIVKSILQRSAARPAPLPATRDTLLSKLSLEARFTRGGVLAYLKANPGAVTSGIVTALGGEMNIEERPTATKRACSILQQLKLAELICSTRLDEPTGLGDKLRWYSLD